MAEEKKPAPEQKKQQQKPEEGAEAKKGGVTFSQAYPARVEEVIGRTGTRGDRKSVV